MASYLILSLLGQYFAELSASNLWPFCNEIRIGDLGSFLRFSADEDTLQLCQHVIIVALNAGQRLD